MSDDRTIRLMRMIADEVAKIADEDTAARILATLQVTLEALDKGVEPFMKTRDGEAACTTVKFILAGIGSRISNWPEEKIAECIKELGTFAFGEEPLVTCIPFNKDLPN